ncbi:uncharacterized protein T551_03121 [Pneumocystis jirovecii RU7]|uniref:Protein import receptor MAS20 n=1 Tax=Pneumocystis jirovecii (strain RU7) TaxID=1408657 RepID=A0A0W4ZFG8_PNEJ7|nr:uncharacterized protein T551_03121 [Pneumocystis jirovecii RU7]KTW27127.1 hypothetical protein T551_03121 [Pneumocystis jirovecii RU7]
MKTSWIVSIALSTYALHFDYKRRNNAAFRRKLSKKSILLDFFLCFIEGRDKKKLSQVQRQEALQQEEALAQAIRKAYHEVQRCALPHLIEEREQFFMQEVAKGEGLYAQGSHKFIEAASCFFRALKVYPNQMELMVIYEKTIPKEVNAIIVKLLQLDETENAIKNIDDAPE